jgi:hypothetical protein
MVVTKMEVPRTFVIQPGDARPKSLHPIAITDAMPAKPIAPTAPTANRVNTRSVNTAIVENPCNTSDILRIFGWPE